MDDKDIVIDEIDDAGTIILGDEDTTDVAYPKVIKVERTQFSIFEIKRRFEKNGIIIDPEFQRNYVWNQKQKSELIESVIMGIPLPLIYLAENEDGKLIVVDGRQRLTTFFDFIDNGYKLKQLKILKELNEFDFLMLQKLYPSYVSTIEDFQLVIQVIKYPTADRVRFDIFDRVNRGGTRLNNQEMRNALYQGVATKLLRKLAGDDTFQKATGYGIKGNRMKDQYIILRALSFYLLENNYLFVHQQPYVYRSDMEDLLGKTMTFINHQKAIQDKLETIFLEVMQLSYAVLGNNAFRIMGDEDVKRRPISMTLFESLFYYLSLHLCHSDHKKIICDYEQLIHNHQFIEFLTYNVDSAESVKGRFQMIKQIYNNGGMYVK